MAERIDLDGAESTPPERETPAGVPRWVIVSVAIVVALTVLLVIGMVTGIGGDHGPGRHGGGGEHRAPAHQR